MQKLDGIFKICIFGDGGVGKTTLVNKYLTGVFVGDTGITIGVDFHLKKIKLKDKLVKLQIWDFAGEERFRFLLPSYARGAVGGIFMYDITRFSSFRNFAEWLKIFRNGSIEAELQIPIPIPILLVGGKADLEDQRSVHSEYAFEMARSANLCGFVECSAKTGQNVEKIFQTIARRIMESQKLV